MKMVIMDAGRENEKNKVVGSLFFFSGDQEDTTVGLRHARCGESSKPLRRPNLTCICVIHSSLDWAMSTPIVFSAHLAHILPNINMDVTTIRMQHAGSADEIRLVHDSL